MPFSSMRLRTALGLTERDRMRRTIGRLARAAGPAPAIELEDGDRVGVVGGGPAGSLFATFLLRMADTVGLAIDVDVYEARRFEHKGPAGCNHCGGIVSEFLVQLLSVEGVNLPPAVVQRGIDSYMLHMDVGSVRIETPTLERRIAAVYRGNGPRVSEDSGFHSFDRFLQDRAVGHGARIHRRLVSDLARRSDGRVRLRGPDGLDETYDLVAIASGINSQLLEHVRDLDEPDDLPDALRTFICEFPLGRRHVRERLGNSMHVFLLDIPRLEFAALIPKGEYATLCMLGHDIDDELVGALLDAPQVRRLFPDGAIPPLACHCFPRINVRGSARPYADRVVLVGDAGVTRLYKDGIGGAYRTAKAAANAAVLHGISAESFAENYAPTCRTIDRDNTIGKVIFGFSHLFQRWRFVRRALLRMTSREQQGNGARPMSGVLWDMFTGSAPYREILLRTIRPGFVGSLLWNLTAGNLSFSGRSPTEWEPHEIR